MKALRTYVGNHKNITLPHHAHRLSHFYDDESVPDSHNAMKVLEDTVNSVPLSECNKFQDYPFLDELKEMFRAKAAGCHESDGCNEGPTGFYGHFDKHAISDEHVTFLPCRGKCHVLVAVPNLSPLHQWGTKEFSSWRETLKQADKVSVTMFFENFLAEAGCNENEVFVISMSPGDFLTFHATGYYHAVIIEAHPDEKRLMFVFHCLRTLHDSETLN